VKPPADVLCVEILTTRTLTARRPELILQPAVTLGVSGRRLGRVLLDPTWRTASVEAVTRPPSP